MNKQRIKKALVSKRERYEREYEHWLKQEVGSEEYNKSHARLNELEDAISKLEMQIRDQWIDISKYVAGTVVTVGTGLVVLKFEETNSLCSALKGVVVGLVNPKKMF